MKRRIVTGAVSLLILALLVWAFIPAPTEVEIATVTRGRFERSVQEDGKTRLRDRYVVSTPLAGRVTRIHLKQGDAVAINTVVATLWPAAPAMLDERSRAEQVPRIGAMQATVARAQANRQRAKAALDQATTELKRSETLAQQGFVSPNQNETGRLTVRLREKEHESARQEESAAHYELEQARAALKQFSQPASSPADAQQHAFDVKSPVSGKVLKVLQQSEGIVMAGTPLMELGHLTVLEVVVDILTEDAAQIKPGTLVRLSNWRGPDILEGQVRLIESAAFTKVSALGIEEQRINAIIDLTSSPEKWRPLGDGFNVDVRVLVQVVENAVIVPVSALFPMGARSALFVLDEGRARLTEIEVAERNGAEAWVKSGLSPGTRVIIYPDTKLRNGARVRVRPQSSSLK